MSGLSRANKLTRPAQMAMLDQTDGYTLGIAEWIAVAGTIVWTAVIFGNKVLGGEPDTSVIHTSLLLELLTLFVPVALMWLVALTVRAARLRHQEHQELLHAIDDLRTTWLSQAQHTGSANEPDVAKKLEEIAETARKTENALATFQTSRREGQRPSAPAPAAKPLEDQGALALGTPAEEMNPPLPINQFIRALNFPETAEDEDGFVALRHALKDRKSAQVIQAAQDVLTLLSQDGIYMDDLRPDMARPEIWRLFAKGARGREVAALGGVRDRTSLTLAAARTKQDPIFRDAVHHFLRRFDQMFTAFEAEASDSEISALSETRTARAFMLLGRVAGTFD